MTFLQPWAWIGLVALAAPILAHLLARRAARRLPFPTVRFLPAAIETPVSRHRLTDISLLVVRCLILVAATAALAQPAWVTADQRRALDGSLARAIIVDSGVATAADPVAAELSMAATRVRVARAGAPARLLGEAATWLAQQPMRREIVLVSDFPASAVSKADLDQIPAGIGIRLVPVSSAGRSRETVESREGPELLTASADRVNATAVRNAAIAQGASSTGRKDRPIALLFPGHEGRDALLKAARDIDQPWMFDAVRAIAEDRLVRAAASESGRPVADLVAPLTGPINGEPHLVLVMNVAPASLMSAAVIGAAAHAVAPPPMPDVAVRHTADQLKAWERPPSAVAPEYAPPSDQSRGRWLWAAALALMAIERVIARRTRRPRLAANTEVRDVARVA